MIKTRCRGLFESDIMPIIENDSATHDLRVWGDNDRLPQSGVAQIEPMY
jgi:glutamate 5-kinase